MDEGERVLLVDDDEDVRTIMAEVLRDEGFHVETARDGLEAMDVALRVRPAVIVLDGDMPRLSGRSFRHRQLGTPSLAAIPVVLASGRHEDRPWVHDIHPDAVLAKPFAPDELVSAVRRQLAGRTRDTNGRASASP